MSISAIANSIFNQQQTGATNPYQQQIQQLSQALQSGNLSAAQSDYAALQQSFSQPASLTPPSTTNTSMPAIANPIAQAFTQLGTDLQSGNLSAAQKDFSTVQQDIQAQVGSGVSHLHHGHRLGGSGGSSGGLNFLTQDPTQTAASSTPAAAQQSYAAWQQQIEQSSFGAGSLSAQTGALEDQPPLSLVA